MDLVVPARVPEAVREEVRRLAVEVFKIIDCSGMARVDFFVEDDARVLVNELNTIPGFTATSVYAKLFDASGIPYVELLERLLAIGAGALRGGAPLPALAGCLLQQAELLDLGLVLPRGSSVIQSR